MSRDQTRQFAHQIRNAGLSVLLLLVLLIAGCNRTVYVVQNPDGTYTEVEPVATVEGDGDITLHDDDLVVIDVLPSNNYVMVDGGDDPLYLQVTVGAREEVDVNRSPLNVSIVLDRSGSMSGQKIRDARDAAIWLIDHLADGDRVSLVSYSSEATVDIGSTQVNSDTRGELIAMVERVQAGGNTFLSGGLEKGAGEVRDGFDEEYLNRVVLLSDGLANEGITDAQELTRIADKYREEGITITTMGVGYDYNEDLMADLATFGGGNYYYIESSRALATTFGRELDVLTGTVVRDAVLILELPEEVQVRDVYGYHYEQNGNQLKVFMNSVSSGEERRLLLSLDVPRGRAGEHHALFDDGHLEFRNEIEKKTQQVGLKPIEVTYTDDEEQVAQAYNVPVMRKVESVKNAIARQEAMDALNRGDRQSAQRVIQKRVQENRSSAIMFDDDVIAGELEDIEDVEEEVKAAPAAGSTDMKRMNKARKEEALDALIH